MNELSRDYLSSILRYDKESGIFTWLVKRKSAGGKIGPGERAGFASPDGRRRIGIDGREYKEHRLAWFYVHGVWPKKLDHIDSDVSNNRIANLRDVTHEQNMQNQRDAHCDSQSGLLGVSWHAHRSKWHARINLKGKTHHLGYFDDRHAAYAAYLSAKKRLHPFQTIAA